MSYRNNLIRTLGSLAWGIIPLLAFLVFLPSPLDIDREGTLFIFFLLLLLNLFALLLPFRETLLQKFFTPLMGLLSVAAMVLSCAAIRTTGGLQSPLFPLLILVTAYAVSLFSSTSGALILPLLSASIYAAHVFLFFSPAKEDLQLLATQLLFLFLCVFFVDGMGRESRARVEEKRQAMEELRILSERNRDSSRFVTAVSFEMRSPLTSLHGFSELLATKDFPRDKEAEYVEIISKAAEDLSRLVEDLLDISRLESGRTRLEKGVISVQDILRPALDAYAAEQEPRDLLADFPSRPFMLWVDPRRMERAFRSIFAFLARKTGKGAEVRVSAGSQADQAVITINYRVADADGDAAGEDFPFSSPPAEDEEGLELAMARRIVEAHGGKVNLVKATGGWSAVIIRIPLASPLLQEEVTLASSGG